ncbi:uncharacterized protein PV06_10658 [Exophiala oligosperma]|uniref:Thioesterase domain-containing protein n=2 Tax=Chaetothyriales TaxID=34395 RepID=A0A0D2D403_9EURO|nr:uncharacterized protein PV06_10658 [Exophiala oligosperma]KAJ9640128.1 hypothetical protein H2204_003353 [Knufia peltigerae]KIW37025.1 hypothetical protein PV06_10658 [Exophiala oligosperma]
MPFQSTSSVLPLPSTPHNWTMTTPTWAHFLAFINSTPAPEDELDYFRSLPWTKDYLDNPEFKAVQTTSRIPKSTNDDNFFARTLQGDDTIQHWLALIPKAFVPLPQQTDTPPIGTLNGRTTRKIRDTHQSDLLLLLHLNNGLNGFADVVHGGALCAIFDEALSFCVEARRQLTTDARELIYTAKLTISYLAPVRSPSTVVVKCWLEAAHGRKWYVRGQLIGEDGTIYSEAEGLWVSAGQKL